jgi:hypothetical protein
LGSVGDSSDGVDEIVLRGVDSEDSHPVEPNSEAASGFCRISAEHPVPAEKMRLPVTKSGVGSDVTVSRLVDTHNDSRPAWIDKWC